MIRLVALLIMSVLVYSGCGGQASGSQDANSPAPEAKSAQSNDDTEVSTPTKIWRGGEQATTLEETANEPIETPIEEVVDETDANEETLEATSAQGSPDLLGGNLWVAGQANLLSEEVEKTLSEGFKWGGDSAPESKNDASSESAQQAPSVHEELAVIRAEQATILAEMKTLRAQAEQERLAAASETEASRKKMVEENALAKAELQKELDRMKADAEQERMAAIGQAEANRIKTEQENELAKAEAQKELDRLKADAEKERMAAIAQAEADRVKTEQENALAKAEAQEELDRMKAEAEKERLTALSDAEAARKEAETLAMARAEAEAALLDARNKELVKGEEIEVAVTPTPKPKLSGPKGTIELAELDLSAQRDGVFGVELASDALIENLNGTKIELAAYFYDEKGKPLKDSDKVNRSSKGQVYVGKESMVSSDNYVLKDKLFIPFEQLELAVDVTHSVQVELVLWEYSRGRGNRLAATPKTTFSRVANASSLAKDELHRSDLTGNWRNGDALITMAQQDNTIVLNGLKVVPYNIVSEAWTYERGRLQGMVINKRKLPPVTRIWEFDLRISQDGNTLAGTYHRADRKGNFAFDSEPFVWTRIP